MNVRDAILASRPIFFWEALEGAAAGKIIDSAGRQPAGTFVTGTASFQGHFAGNQRLGPVFGFDGSGAAKLANATPNPTLTAPFSFEALVLPDSSSSGDRLIFGNGSGAGATVPGFHLRLLTGNGLRIILIKDGSNFVGVDAGAGAVRQGNVGGRPEQMSHVYFAYDGSGAAASALQLWVNGRKQAVTSLSGGTVTTIATTQVLVIAGGFSGLPGFSGFVKNAAYYDRVLAPSEIVDHFQLAAYGPPVPMVRRRALASGSLSAIKTIEGLARASVNTVMGVPIASVKTVEGLA